MAVFLKYLLLEIPGWCAAGAVLFLLWYFLELPLWLAWLLFAGNVVKDLILFRFLRDAYASEPSRLVGPELLVGARGVVVEELAPQGVVRVRGERWHSDLCASGESLPTGAAVIVREVRGLRLRVDPAEDQAQEARDT